MNAESGAGVPAGLSTVADTAAPGGTSPPVHPTPAWVRGRHSLRLPAFWLLVGLLAIGAWRIGSLLWAESRGYPAATATAVLLFTLYTIPFVVVVRSLDYFEREPPLLLLAAFGWGGLVATALAVPGDRAVHDLLAKLVSPGFAAAWGPALAGPAIEEVVKTLGVVVIVLIARAQVNSVVDGFVYGAFVGLGFQVIEDVVYALGAVALAGRGDSTVPVIGSFLLRGFLGGLWSHTLFSALAGAGIASVVRGTSRWRYLVAFGALAGAWLFHFLWNSPWLADGFGYGALGVITVLLFKGIPALLLVLTLIRQAGRQEAAYYLRLLQGDEDVATTRELAALSAGRTRSAARRYAYARGGRDAEHCVRRLQRAQARLALEMSRGGPDVSACRAAALAARQDMLAVGHPEAYAPHGMPPPVWLWLLGVAGAGALAVLLALAIGALGGG